jgi:hypothetical protein
MTGANLPMSDRQIEPRREYPLAPRTRSRSLPTQVSTSLLRPVAFYRSLALVSETRQWLWVGVMVLILVGLSAVQQESLRGSATGAAVPDFGSPPAGDFGGGPIGGDFGGMPGDFGGPPPGGPPSPGGAATGSGVTANWTTAILAAAGMVLGWAVLTVLLAEVSLFRGVAPRLGQNFQIAIWASLPLGFMAAVQLLYYGAGGEVGEPGVAGVVPMIPGYETFPTFVQALLLSLGGRTTLFWLWSLALIYFGARFALQGWRWSSMLVVVLWVIILVVAPVITGAVTPPAQDLPPLLDTLPFGPGMGPEGEMPGEGFPGGAFNPEATDEVFPPGDFSAEEPGVEAPPMDASTDVDSSDAGGVSEETDIEAETGTMESNTEAPVRPSAPRP